MTGGYGMAAGISRTGYVEYCGNSSDDKRKSWYSHLLKILLMVEMSLTSYVVVLWE
jgi:hypothetical protein